jgi:hypothetical protein
MPTFRIQAPDGNTYEVTAPEGATEEEVMARVRQQAASRPAAPEPKVDVPSRAEAGRAAFDNPLQAALVGVGRFLTEVGQGGKQMGLMAGEAMGLADEGAAQEYTEQINRERQEWDEFTEGAGMEDVGYYGAMLAPALVAPGAGIARTAGMGALEAGMMPAEEATVAEKAKQAATGAAVAGGLRAAPDLWAANKARRQRKKAESLDPDVMAMASEYPDVRVSPDLYAPSTARSVAREYVDVPVISDLTRGRKMRNDAERMLRDQANRNVSRDSIQESFTKGVDVMEGQNRRQWNNVWESMPDARVSNANLGMDFSALVRELQEDPKISQKSIDEVIEMWSDRPKRWMSAEDLHDFRKKFGNQAASRFTKEGLDSVVPGRVYGIITDELRRGVNHTYGDAGLKLFDDAVENTKQMKRTIRNTRLQKQAINDRIDSESAFINIAKSQDRDRRGALKEILGSQGAESVRDEITDHILNVFTTKSPKAAAKEIRVLQNTFDDFFDPDTTAVYRGLEKFLENMPSRDVGDFLKSSALTGAVAGGLGAATGGGVVPALAMGGLATALRRRDVTAMLQKLSTTPKDSKLYQALTSQISEALAVAAGTQQSRPVPEIEIRNGRTQ